MIAPVVLYGNGAYVPHAFRVGMMLRTVCEGIDVAWVPVLEIDKVLLCFAGGNPARPTEEMVVSTLGRGGLLGLIRDLQSVEQQMWPSEPA